MTDYFEDQIINNTNWSELYRQKLALLEILSQNMPAHQKEKLEGLLCFIDAIQDLAVETYGISAKEVFLHREVHS